MSIYTPSTDRNIKISQFIQATGETAFAAKYYLEFANWNLQLAKKQYRTVKKNLGSSKDETRFSKSYMLQLLRTKAEKLQLDNAFTLDNGHAQIEDCSMQQMIDYGKWIQLVNLLEELQ